MGRQLSATEPHTAVLVLSSESLGIRRRVRLARCWNWRARATRRSASGGACSGTTRPSSATRARAARATFIEAREPEDAVAAQGRRPSATRAAASLHVIGAVVPAPERCDRAGRGRRVRTLAREPAMTPGVRKDGEAVIASLAFHRYSEDALQKSAASGACRAAWRPPRRCSSRISTPRPRGRATSWRRSSSAPRRRPENVGDCACAPCSSRRRNGGSARATASRARDGSSIIAARCRASSQCISTGRSTFTKAPDCATASPVRPTRTNCQRTCLEDRDLQSVTGDRRSPTVRRSAPRAVRWSCRQFRALGTGDVRIGDARADRIGNAEDFAWSMTGRRRRLHRCICRPRASRARPSGSGPGPGR